MDAELERVLEALLDPAGETVVRAPVALARRLQAGLEEAGWAVVTVDRAPVFDRETLLHALYQACELPAWFGFNWDALLDALATWSARPGGGGALVFRDLDLLEERDPEVAATFLELVEDARGERQAPLRVVRLVS